MRRMKKIRINKAIFSDEAIQITIKAYNGYANMSVESRDKYAIVTFQDCKYDEELTAKEFENYLIGIENS